MRLSTACCARALQRCTSRICVHFLLTFQEIRPISKTRNQINYHPQSGWFEDAPLKGGAVARSPLRGHCYWDSLLQKALLQAALPEGTVVGCPLGRRRHRMPPRGAPGPASVYDQLDRRVEKSPSISCSARCSCCSWFRMYFRIISSSNPTVLTQYPLAQKWSPVKFRTRPRYSR